MIKHLLILILPILNISCATQSGKEVTGIKKSAIEKPSLIKGKYKIVKTEKGKMSWYSVKTNFGTATASGEKFANHKATVAHKKLKMGTMVRVTNLKNGKSKILRVNDRGPFKPGRIVDVAVGMSSSDHLAFHTDGVVPCKVEVLEEVKIEVPAPIETST